MSDALRKINLSTAECALTIESASGETTYENILITRIEPNDQRTRKLILDKQGKTDGYVANLNSDQPMILNIGLRSVGNDLDSVLSDTFSSGDRISINIADTKSLAQISLRKGVISTPPKNRVIEEGETLLDSSLVIETAYKNFEMDA
jgi:hypothetical protein